MKCPNCGEQKRFYHYVKTEVAITREVEPGADWADFLQAEPVEEEEVTDPDEEGVVEILCAVCDTMVYP